MKEKGDVLVAFWFIGLVVCELWLILLMCKGGLLEVE